MNQYQLQGRMGKGSYATVERAVDRETGDEYVSLRSREARRVGGVADGRDRRG